MGAGDWLMASSYAAGLYDELPSHPVAFGDGRRSYWHEVFENNPAVATPSDVLMKRPVQWLAHHKGARPYIDYARTTPERWAFVPDGGRKPGTIVFSADEARRLTEPGYVVVEPHIKATASPNKHWGFARYQAVVDALPHVRFVQPDYGRRLLDDVEAVSTPTFRTACRLIRDADAYLGPEGGLHHAAAAVGTPAVVIFGGFISPDVTGYAGHVNVAGDAACGSRVPCAHCHAAMAAIQPEAVAGYVDRIVKGEPCASINLV
jgi:hypothetical protein